MPAVFSPPQGEGPFGTVMIEAMARGTPIVALRRGSVPEVIEDGVTGLICEAPEELVPAGCHRSRLRGGVSPAGHHGTEVSGGSRQRAGRRAGQEPASP
ncbi:glycosyltransferase [Streptomyces sp. x-19]|uniref:glycosyltransferase n=1 Tax=Streptomyces sp. x-19 TaxID=2789280 RepID=UPI00397F402F